MEERTVQSRVREMAIVASSAELKSFDFAGKRSLVIARSWWIRLPSERFRGFSAVVVPMSVGRDGLLPELGASGAVERLYTLMRSSEDPVARKRLSASPSVGGETARQRIAEAWAAKRKVLEKVMSEPEAAPA